MAQLNPYLTFNGNCEEAFNFYKSVFGGELQMSKFSDMPPDPKYPLSETDKNKVLHVAFPLSKSSILMGSDTGGEWSHNFSQGTNFSLSIGAESRAEADKIFGGLSKGGKVTMPMGDTFWNSYFGMFTDKFGIAWMVSYDAPDRQKN